MTIPFVDFIKSVKARLFPAAEPGKAVATNLVRAEKSQGERLRKTVLPKTNATRPATVAEPRPAVARPEAIKMSPAPPRLPTLPFNPATKFSAPRETRKPVAVTAQSEVERVISLQICDILDQLPPGQIKPRDSFDAARGIVLKASEIEKGMASGKPSISLASIYQQAPEIFIQSVSPDDSTPVLLPFNKVLDQFASLRVRPDQEIDPDVPQLETPFLKVTIEDTERFGTDIKPLQTSPHPPLKMETATAKSFAAAEPEPAARETPGSTSAPSVPSVPSVPPVPSIEPTGETGERDPEPVAPRKIPFHLPPNGTGASASEKVPASSGPPVPTVPTVPTVAMPATPRRVPFTHPSEQIRPKFTLVPGVEPKQEAPPAEKKAQVSAPDSARSGGGAKVALPLQSLLGTLPAFQLTGSPMVVGEDVCAEFPLSLIEPQLASGRVVVPAKVFQRAIPEIHRALFMIDPNETPVSLPLQEILEHLPPSTLRMRDDQEEEVALKEKFTTPFSLQADEDKKHFEAMAAAALKISEEPAKEQPDKETAKGSASDVQRSTAEEAPNSPKVIIACASVLPGVKACAITFADGLSLAGNLPPELDAEGICAMAPPLLHKIDNHLLDAKLGALVAMTLRCEKSALTFFMRNNICLTALHVDGEGLAAETRDQLASMVQELSRTYSQPEPPHVDH